MDLDHHNKTIAIAEGSSNGTASPRPIVTRTP
jgi:hypothetical protein